MNNIPKKVLVNILLPQTPEVLFNRAALMDIGFLEAKKLEDYQNYVFHDVDSVPMDTRNLYACPQNPVHLCAARDKNNFRYFYVDSSVQVLYIMIRHFNLFYSG